MILKPFLENFEIRTATSSQIGCEFEFYVYIQRLFCVKAQVSLFIFHHPDNILCG